jgi:hypothetical protein
MAELVADCPRCGANKITCDLISALTVGNQYGWQNWYEAFCVCRQCHRSTVFILSESVDSNYKKVHEIGLVNLESAVNNYVNIEGFISLKDNVKDNPPEHVPENIEAVFREGATCMAVGCNNAAGTMFRLCIDLVTKEMLPEGEVEGLNNRTRRNLGLRLPWLFDNKYLPESLRDLASCVKEDGNDGAHSGTLTKNDAADLHDFTVILLERIYTEPERLRIAKERTQQRRSENT